MLALACGARRGGARRSRALAAWGRPEGARRAPALGFRPLPPCAATLHLLGRRLECAGVEAPLGAGAESLVARTPGATDRPHAVAPAGALAGPTLRGSRPPGAPGGHLLAALAPQVGVTRAPQAVAQKPHERTAGETGLGPLVLARRVVTREALLTPPAVAPSLGAAGGDDVMLVTATPPHRRSASELSGAAPPGGAPPETAAPRE